MSYSIKLRALGGKLEIVSTGSPTHLPDGVFTLNGHEDATATSLTVTRLDPNQQVVIQATAHSTKKVTP